VDAHVTAPAAKAIEPGKMVAIMGTSTCHVMNGPGGTELAEVPGMCGVVDGGIVAGCGATRPGRAASATSSPGSSTASWAPTAREAIERGVSCSSC
jgi:ribulose kinase